MGLDSKKVLFYYVKVHISKLLGECARIQGQVLNWKVSNYYRVYVKKIPVTLNLPEASNFDFLIFSRLHDLEMLQFVIVKAKFDKILIVLNEIKEWEFESVLFWSTEASWARIADGKSLYHLGLIFGATVLLQIHIFLWS